MPKVTREQIDELVLQLEIFIGAVGDRWGSPPKEGIVDALVKILIPGDPSAADEIGHSGDSL